MLGMRRTGRPRQVGQRPAGAQCRQPDRRPEGQGRRAARAPRVQLSQGRGQGVRRLAGPSVRGRTRAADRCRLPAGAQGRPGDGGPLSDQAGRRRSGGLAGGPVLPAGTGTAGDRRRRVGRRPVPRRSCHAAAAADRESPHQSGVGLSRRPSTGMGAAPPRMPGIRPGIPFAPIRSAAWRSTTRPAHRPRSRTRGCWSLSSRRS